MSMRYKLMRDINPSGTGAALKVVDPHGGIGGRLTVPAQNAPRERKGGGRLLGRFPHGRRAAGVAWGRQEAESAEAGQEAAAKGLPAPSAARERGRPPAAGRDP